MGGCLNCGGQGRGKWYDKDPRFHYKVKARIECYSTPEYMINSPAHRLMANVKPHRDQSVGFRPSREW